jgi:CheY-like chemotaxis protein
LHALNLFVAQLHSEPEQAERDRLAHQIEVAVANMNDLFGALLDISRLDAGAQSVSVSSFPVYSVLRRIETTFATAAHVKGLRFRVVRSSAWVRSDAILLERILLNLVSNAVRYTASGGIVVGCRHSGDTLRIDVIDSGIGIAQDQQRNVFSEFYQVAGSNGVGGDGLGLGLAIVERLCVLLGHSVSVRSTVGRGSQFSVSVPMVRTPAAAPEPSALIPTRLDRVRGSRVVVLDDDTAILAGMGGLLKGWGCRVVTASSGRDAVASLDGDRPDLIISDFHLKDGQTGIEAVAAICHAFGPSIPAFLISGDTSPDRLREAQARGYHLLHKPVSPMTLRAMMSRLLQIAPGQIVG